MSFLFTIPWSSAASKSSSVCHWKSDHLEKLPARLPNIRICANKTHPQRSTQSVAQFRQIQILWKLDNSSLSVGRMLITRKISGNHQQKHLFGGYPTNTNEFWHPDFLRLINSWAAENSRLQSSIHGWHAHFSDAHVGPRRFYVVSYHTHIVIYRILMNSIPYVCLLMPYVSWFHIQTQPDIITRWLFMAMYIPLYNHEWVGSTPVNPIVSKVRLLSQ